MRYAISTLHSLDDDVPNATDTASSAVDDSSSKVNFSLRYKNKDHVICDELQEYFKLLCEDFDSCKHVQWCI
jgi:hypothetical protein